MSIIAWSSKLSVGVAAMDVQHRQLVDITNKLHDAMLARRGQEVLLDIFDELAKYTETHFDAEEKLLQGYGYPSLANQKRMHNEFIKKLNEHRKQFNNGEIMMTTKLSLFLKEWLTDHIMVEDKKYGTFLEEKSMKKTG